MFEALHDPIKVMRFRFEFSDRRGGIGCHEHFLASFCDDSDLDLAKGGLGDIVLEEVHQLEIFVCHFKDGSPNLFSR